jgi:hypothetical protein
MIHALLVVELSRHTFAPIFQRDKPSLCEHISRQRREMIYAVGKALLSSLGASPPLHARTLNSISSFWEPHFVIPTTNPKFTDDRN